MPAQVKGLADIVQIADGEHTLRADGTVYQWGDDTPDAVHGFITAKTPVQVPGISDAVRISGGQSSFAVRADGTVWGWGVNFTGGLGDGTTHQSLLPEQVTNLTGVTQIASAQEASYGLRPAPAATP